ncbi:glycosyltransferase family 4 protein [Candidatus Sumerlaeota bacterium]|nr:glycosyltransferase family 4 protein [Candidatus Sumerlaeota bacterium]
MTDSRPILVLTTEPLPLPGRSVTGAGMRAWGLAQGLRARGLDAVVAMPVPAGDPPDAKTLQQHGAAMFKRAELNAFARKMNPSAVVLQHWGLARELGDVDAPLAIDLAGPHLLERLYWESPDPEQDRIEKIGALSRADFVCCSGEYQRHYFLPFLSEAGWDVTLRDALPVIPYSLDPALPQAGERDPFTLVYGGYFLPWQDPSIALEACLEAMDEAGAGRLEFYGGMHPQLDVSGGKFEPLLERLAAHPRVTMCGPLPFDALTQRYCRAGLAVDLMARNPERELAFTTRTLVYLWCGLPVLYNDYSELSSWIERYGAGATLNPEDPAAVKRVMLEYLRDSAAWDERREAARRLMREQFDWTKTIDPLAAWCADPKPRANKELSGQNSGEQTRRLLQQTKDELQKTRSELETLQGKWHVRLARKMHGWAPLLAPLVWLALTPLAWIVRRELRRGESE